MSANSANSYRVAPNRTLHSIATERCDQSTPLECGARTAGIEIVSEHYPQQIALGRLRKLASSGLPVIPMVMAIFEVIEEAIPSSDQKACAWRQTGTSVVPIIGSVAA
jgi:hypothetical protein